MTSDRPSLFLLERNYGPATEADLARMHRALTRAVMRLARAGMPLRIVNAVFVPDQARCLYVVEAAVANQVVEASNIAGLANGTVRPAIRLEDMSLRPDPAGRGDRTPIER
jgi:hypothetical protein